LLSAALQIFKIGTSVTHAQDLPKDLLDVDMKFFNLVIIESVLLTSARPRDFKFYFKILVEDHPRVSLPATSRRLWGHAPTHKKFLTHIINFEKPTSQAPSSERKNYTSHLSERHSQNQSTTIAHLSSFREFPHSF
jgi:hypothetical protein